MIPVQFAGDGTASITVYKSQNCIAREIPRSHKARMPKRPRHPVPVATPFSISSQFTGPPFGYSLESAELRRKLLEEIGHSAEPAAGGPKAAGSKAAKSSRRGAKTRSRKQE